MTRLVPKHLNAGVCRLVFVALAAPALVAGARSQDAPAQTAPAAQDPQLNPTGRVMRIVVPLKENGAYLGDVELQINPDDSLEVVGWQGSNNWRGSWIPQRWNPCGPCRNAASSYPSPASRRSACR